MPRLRCAGCRGRHPSATLSQHMTASRIVCRRSAPQPPVIVVKNGAHRWCLIWVR
jgi:hypothetical protein